MMLLIKTGSTSNRLQVFLGDNSVATGAGKTGLLYSGVTAYYFIDGAASAVAITMATATVGTYASGGFKEIDATNMPGWYEFDPPNLAFASTVRQVSLMIKAASIVPVNIQIQLVPWDPQDGVRQGMTALPNVAAGSAGAVATGDASGRVTVITNSDKTGYSLTTAPPTGAAIAALILATPANKLATDASGYVTTTGGGGGGPTLSQITAALLDNPSIPLQTDGEGHVNAAVVLGAVASVAGNVGGSIAGTVSGVVNGVTLDMTAVVPRTNTAETVGDSLHAARASGFGALIVNTTALTETLYESDGSTVAKAWNIDSATAPTQRT